MARAKRKVPTHPDLIRTAEELAGPIDLDRLVADGVLREDGGWFEVLDPTRLPEVARYRIRAMKPGNRVKFRKPSKRLTKFLGELRPEPANGRRNGSPPVGAAY
jgi:hypothetical protein